MYLVSVKLIWMLLSKNNMAFALKKPRVYHHFQQKTWFGRFEGHEFYVFPFSRGICGNLGLPDLCPSHIDSSPHSFGGFMIGSMTAMATILHNHGTVFGNGQFTHNVRLDNDDWISDHPKPF